MLIYSSRETSRVILVKTKSLSLVSLIFFFFGFKISSIAPLGLFTAPLAIASGAFMNLSYPPDPK